MALELVNILFRKENTDHALGCEDDNIKMQFKLLSVYSPSAVLILSWVGNK